MRTTYSPTWQTWLTRLWLCSLAILLTASADAQASYFSQDIRMIPESGIRLSMTPVYEAAPIAGFFPVRLTLANNSGKARTWHLQAKQKSYRSGIGSSQMTQQLSVPDRSEQMFEVYVPMLSTVPASTSWISQIVTIELTGYGIRSATLRGNAAPNPRALPFIAMSDALHLRSWPVLAKALEKKRTQLYGSKLSPDLMPRQWRGYAGIWRLLITAEEWDGLPAEVRRAVVDWVLMGGELHLFHRHRLPRGNRDYGGFRFEGITSDHAQKSLGLGHVALLTWNGQEIDLSYQHDLQMGDKALYDHFGREYKRGQWLFIDQMPEKRFSQMVLWGLGVFLLLYFILVGPFNVWRSGKRGKRLQLFFTTPLLAVICSVILCVLLAMHAGFGGWGLRTTGVYLFPHHPKAMVMQEQIAKTAFMLKTDFRVGEDLFMTPIHLDKLPGKAKPTYHLNLTDQHLSGDWFANNAVQAQFIIALKPTRAGIEPTPNAESALTLRSSINAALTDLYVQDESGQYWHGRDVAAGRETVLQPISKAQYRRWRSQTIGAQTGPKLQRALRRIDAQPGTFVAIAQHAPDFAIETLPGIHWKSQTAVIFGHLPSATTATLDGTFILQAMQDVHVP